VNVAKKLQSVPFNVSHDGQSTSFQNSPLDLVRLEPMLTGRSLSLSVQPDSCRVNWQAGTEAKGDQCSLNLNLEGIGSNTPNALSQTLSGINNWISSWLGGGNGQSAPNSPQPVQPPVLTQPHSVQMLHRPDSVQPEEIDSKPISSVSLRAELPINTKNNAKNISVQPGDTLWGIAQDQLGDGNRWQELRKPDGNPFKPEEAINLKIGDQVMLSDGKAQPVVPEQTQKPNSSKSDIEYGSYSPPVDRNFLDKVKGIGERLQVAPEYLMAVMGFETGGSYSPSVKNKAGSGATGLIQFMPATAKGLETSTEQLAKMSAIQQLDYVEKYMSRQAGRLKSLEDVYMAVLYPKAVGQPSDGAIFNRGTKAYTQNAGLDINKDGKVTPAEATEKVRKFLPKSEIFNA
jgi:hypothetical protein